MTSQSGKPSWEGGGSIGAQGERDGMELGFLCWLTAGQTVEGSVCQVKSITNAKGWRWD